MDLVSWNVRGAVGELSDFVSPIEAYMSWARHGFIHAEYKDAVSIKQNPNLYDSFEIFTHLSQNVKWNNADQASRGLRALSQFTRYASCEAYDDEFELTRKLEDLRIACEEDGFSFDMDPRTISQKYAVPLDEFNLEGLTTTTGIHRKLKKLNRALVREKDNLEVIGLSKDLMEATAYAILLEKGLSTERVRKMKAAERCSHAMESLGITANNGSGKTAEGLTLIRKALNKIVEGSAEMRRNDTDEGHGTAGVKLATDAQANLALASALMWCHFVLDKFHEGDPAPF